MNLWISIIGDGTTTQFGVINANTGASAVARISKITGTANSSIDWNLHDSSGTPYDNAQANRYLDELSTAHGINFI